MDKKICAVYARVSKFDKQNPETQLLPLRQYARRRGFEIVHEYVDDGICGAVRQRPSLDQMMRDAALARFEAVIVARFDRFARNVKHLIDAAEEFETRNIDFISLAEAIDTTTPIGKMFFTILGAVAQFERDLIRERIRMGINRVRQSGIKLGRPLRIVDSERILQMRREKQSLRAIAEVLEVSKDKVRSVLQSLNTKKARKRR
jgi:DNA invertase Pin-like site-specific DNA recombinase